MLPHVSAHLHILCRCKLEAVSTVKNHPLDNFWAHFLITIDFRELFLLQKVLELSKMRLTIRFPHSAECVKGLCPFETHHLLEKVDENFCSPSAWMLWFSCKQKIPVFQTVFCRKTGTRAFSCGATQIGFVKPTLRIRNKVPNLLCYDNGAGSVDAY